MQPLEEEVSRYEATQKTYAISSNSALPRNVFLRHSGTYTPRPQQFDPAVHVHRHYLAVTMSTADDSAVPRRGWDIALVFSEPMDVCIMGTTVKVVNLVYMKPLRHNQRQSPQWKEPWVTHTFAPMKQSPRFSTVFQATLFPVRQIAFAFEPAGDIGKGRETLYEDARVRIPKKHQGTVMHIVNMMKEFVSKHTVEQQQALLDNGFSVLPGAHSIPQDGDGEDED